MDNVDRSDIPSEHPLQSNQQQPTMQPVQDNNIPIALPSLPAAFLNKPLPQTCLKYPGIRRTLIPLLLTHGVVLPTLGVLWFMTEDDSPFRAGGVVLPLGLIGFGIILLAVGIVNMLLLRNAPKAMAC